MAVNSTVNTQRGNYARPGDIYIGQIIAGAVVRRLPAGDNERRTLRVVAVRHGNDHGFTAEDVNAPGEQYIGIFLPTTDVDEQQAYIQFTRVM